MTVESRRQSVVEPIERCRRANARASHRRRRLVVARTHPSVFTAGDIATHTNDDAPQSDDISMRVVATIARATAAATRTRTRASTSSSSSAAAASSTAVVAARRWCRPNRASSRRRAAASDDDGGDGFIALERALDVARGAGAFAVRDDSVDAVVYVGGGRDARVELERFASATPRDASTLSVRFVAAPKRARATAIRQQMKEMIDALGYAPEDNVAGAMEKQRSASASATFTLEHLETLQRDGYVVIDDAFASDVAMNAAAAARALYTRGIMQNLRQEGRDDDVAVLAVGQLPAGGEFAGLKPCVDLLLGVPDALRRALAEADALFATTSDATPLDADLRSKIARCESPDRLMVARYGPDACRYVPHLDNDPSDPSNDAGTPGLRPSDRVFTVIAYLNPDWVPDHAGRFRAFRVGAAADSDDFRDVDPILGRLVVFDSARLLHEVRPSASDRYACTVWTKDASRVA